MERKSPRLLLSPGSSNGSLAGGSGPFEETQPVEMPGYLGQCTTLLLPFLLFRISLGLCVLSCIVVQQ